MTDLSVASKNLLDICHYLIEKSGIDPVTFSYRRPYTHVAIKLQDAMHDVHTAIELYVCQKNTALTIGAKMPDGTICVFVDLDKNSALFVPEGIFGGKSTFDEQDGVIHEANRNKLHGHSDWRRITDAEGKIIADNWEKIAPKNLQGRAAPWFWLASPYGHYHGHGRVWRGGEVDSDDVNRDCSLPVPVVRSGPARS